MVELNKQLVEEDMILRFHLLDGPSNEQETNKLNIFRKRNTCVVN
jgi:hypothetical protein